METPRRASDEVRDRYLRLFHSFLDGGVQADQFSATFLSMWRNDRDCGVTTGDTVDFIMTSVDCYEPEPDPDSDFEIDEAQLRAEVATATERLTAHRA